MGNSLGRRRWRRRSVEVETSPQAVYLKVLGELGTLSFDPELRTAAQLAGLSPNEETPAPAQAGMAGGGAAAPRPATLAYPSHHVRVLRAVKG